MRLRDPGLVHHANLTLRGRLGPFGAPLQVVASRLFVQEGPLLDFLVGMLQPGVHYVALAITSRDSAAPDFRLLTSRGFTVTIIQTGGVVPSSTLHCVPRDNP
jgi:hypothetical protein